MNVCFKMLIFPSVDVSVSTKRIQNSMLISVFRMKFDNIM